MTRGRWRRILRWTVTGGLALAWAGILCRGRDDSMIPAVVYYATPWLPRMIGGGLGLFLLKNWWARAMAATCVVISLVEGWHSFRLDSLLPAPPDAARVSVWNAGRDLPGMTGAWASMQDADIAAVIETGSFSPDQWERFTALSPDHEWKRFDASTMLGVRGKILSNESLGVHDLFRCHRVRVELPRHGELTVVVADVRSQPWISRKRAMAGILEAAGDDPRAIILGDFNTPPESVWFREWRDKGFTLANDGPRRGFRETWAFGLPLWTLDQIWTGPGWQITRVDHTRPGSDHARVVGTLAP